jgi:hypothetical protein
LIMNSKIDQHDVLALVTSFVVIWITGAGLFQAIMIGIICGALANTLSARDQAGTEEKSEENTEK